MSYEITNMSENPNLRMVEDKGPFTIMEHVRDASVCMHDAMREYYMSKMGVRKRQLLCNTEDAGIIVSAGAMQWFIGDVEASTDVKGAGDLIGKAIKGKVTGESAIKPKYIGDGMLVLEPTYKHLILWDLEDWNGSVVLDDGLFLACQATIDCTVKARSTVSSAVLGKEGLFNCMLRGRGVFCVESECPESELITIDLEEDVVRIDGNMAIAWSPSLKFTVERTTKTLVGSAASGEGFVNVYRGTGRVVLRPTGAVADIASLCLD